MNPFTSSGFYAIIVQDSRARNHVDGSFDANIGVGPFSVVRAERDIDFDCHWFVILLLPWGHGHMPSRYD
jgi:hypothetical protein